MSDAKPFISSPMQVETAWIDYNGHMNMAYYNVLFDRCADQMFDRLGIGLDYVTSRRKSVFTAEFHICYLRELHEGDQVSVSMQLVDHDPKRVHFYQEIHHADGWLSATAEALSVHVDLETRKSAPFPDDIAANLDALAREHNTLPRPERAGRSIGIRRKV